MGKQVLSAVYLSISTVHTSHSSWFVIFKLQQVQLYYAGLSRYIGVFDTREEAAAAYEMARDCCDSFAEENPTKDQVKRNVALMRNAAFESEEQDEMDEDSEEIEEDVGVIVIAEEKESAATIVEREMSKLW